MKNALLPLMSDAGQQAKVGYTADYVFHVKR